uniref:Uncharacterized protein n=1 Tax=Pyxicephalus adspersus TaxID=30357 RepID=A0AAV3AX49_PYXAD|nr:TPA: hypothetical protein GDO54_006998 [Pyxicephalus adspersus]
MILYNLGASRHQYHVVLPLYVHFFFIQLVPYILFLKKMYMKNCGPKIFIAFSPLHLAMLLILVKGDGPITKPTDLFITKHTVFFGV